MKSNPHGYLLSELAEVVGATIKGDASLCITSLNTLAAAQNDQLAFLANTRYVSQLSSSMAGAVLVKPEFANQVPHSALVVNDPYLAFARITHLFDWRKEQKTADIAPSAVVNSCATIANNVVIGAGAVIAADVTLDEGVVVGPNVVIGEGCKVARDSRLEAGVVLYPNVWVGERCLIHSGAVLGADGFGFAPSSEGWVKICQLGGVRIGNDVEIGAGTTIDRGALDHTYIADGVKLDNQVQIAHNVRIGEQTAIAGCTAVAGSTRIGRRCTIAGLSGITGHLDIADNTHVTAMTLVSKSVSSAGQIISAGTGQMKHTEWKRNVVRFRQLDEMAKRVAAIEKTIDLISGKG